MYTTCIWDTDCFAVSNNCILSKVYHKWREKGISEVLQECELQGG